MPTIPITKPEKLDAAKRLADLFETVAECIQLQTDSNQAKNERDRLDRMPTRASDAVESLIEKQAEIRENAYASYITVNIHNEMYGRQLRFNPGDHIAEIIFSMVPESDLKTFAARIVESDGALTRKEKLSRRRKLNKRIETNSEKIRELIPAELLGTDSDFFRSPIFEAFSNWKELQSKANGPVDPLGMSINGNGNRYKPAFEFLKIGRYVNPDSPYHPAEFDARFG